MKRVIYWVPVVLWAVGIVVISSLGSASGITPPFPHTDKAVHFVLFGILGGLAAFALRRGHHLSRGKSILWAVLLVFVFGLVDEVRQSFNPGRTSSWWDLLADVAGAFTFAVLVCRIFQGKSASIPRY